MAKYIQADCRLCRNAGIKLFLKGERCYTDKCAIERRAYPAGQHGQKGARRKATEYSVQLSEKQKVKRIYGVLERQFRRYFAMAERMKGITGENLLQILERRLDNVVYRMGFARSRTDARQLVLHGHFNVNGKRINIPSYLVKQGDVVTTKPSEKESVWVKESMEGAERHGVPEWIQIDKSKMAGTFVAYPARDQLTMPINEQLIVELYSK